MQAKFKVGDEVQFKGQHGTVEEVITCYSIRTATGETFIRSEADVSTYVARVKVGDRVRIYNHDVWYSVQAIHNESAWLWDDSGTHVTRPLYDIHRIRVGEV